MELPKIVQCVLNSSSAQVLKEKTRALPPQVVLQSLSTQRSNSTRSRRSVANFQLRKNALLGCAVNLRGAALYSFLDQYITCTAPPLCAAGLLNLGRGAFQGGRAVLGERVDYNFGGDSYTYFPGLETHFLALSDGGGWNCTLCACSADTQELALFLAALQFPVQRR